MGGIRGGTRQCFDKGSRSKFIALHQLCSLPTRSYYFKALYGGGGGVGVELGSVLARVVDLNLKPYID